MIDVTLIQVEELLSYVENIDEFDTSFLESIKQQLRDNRSLSNKQIRAVNNINDMFINK